MNNIAIGKLGETHAEKFLIAQNYEIIQKNFYSRYGEIDIIALGFNSPRRQLVFVEVKTRTSDLFGLAQESITYQKRKKMLKTAIHFMNTSTQKLPHIWRMDAIAVKLNVNLQLEEIKHFKNIFDGY